MSYRIIMDSCGEVPKQYKKDERFISIPLELEVGGVRIIDDETFDQADFIKKVAECPHCPKSSCSSPYSYAQAFKAPVDMIFVVTLSGKLSGSYNSACLGRDLYLEENDEKNIFVIDSKSASGGETQIGLLAMELADQGLEYEEICQRLLKYRDGMHTYFVLDNLETLHKNGRLTGLKAIVASTLSIKPIMSSDDGSIIQLTQAIGMKKGIKKLTESLVKDCVNPIMKRVIITHVNALERAEYVKKLLLEKVEFMEILILDTAGVSTMYANDGGIIVTV